MAVLGMAIQLCVHGMALAEPPFVVVLGVAQDGGVPQAGAQAHPAWDDASRRQRVACLGIVDPITCKRWMIDATPDFRDQLHALQTLTVACVPATGTRAALDGILLTHAHIGHYTGLMFLGHESMGAKSVRVHAMPRMRAFLSSNGPWDQLVRYENIVLVPLAADQPARLNTRIVVTPFEVPHRQEYSEVVGYHIEGPERAVLYIPDIDSWEELDATDMPIEARIRSVDVAYLDATFYANGEILGRDMTGFPHPFITHSMQRFASLPESERAKIRFIHLNHTNPALVPDSDASRAITAAGFRVAVAGERVNL